MERSCLTVTNWLVRMVAGVASPLGIMTTLFFGSWLCLTSKQAFGAGIILSQPEVIDTREKETFPESRFGSPPSRLDAEGRSRFVTNAIESLRQEEAGGSAGLGEGLVSNRKPAGLEFTQDTSRSGGVQSRPVIAEPGMPQSPANLNPKPEASTARTGIQEVAIIAGDLGFFPKTVFVTRDIPVRLYVTGASKKTLCIMMDLEGQQIRKQIRSQKIEELTFTPAKTGQFRFYCPIGDMEGTLLVKEGSYASEHSNNAGGSAPLVNGVQ
ncbi:MAG: cupredoxin domain-containing protein [Bdellovibrionia bacterium]